MLECPLEIDNLIHAYGTKKVLRGVDLTLQPGQLAGLLGPNGSGKSTLIRCAVGLERPTGGRVRLFGRNIPREAREIRSLVGYMSQTAALFEDLSAAENVAFFGGAFLSGTQELARRTAELLDLLGLADVGQTPVRQFSGGMKERVSLACALVHHPRLLFLDEPTAGVDPVISQEIWNHLRRLAREGVTILLSTHLLEEVYQCSKVVVLRDGVVLAEETPESLLSRGRGTASIRFAGKTEEAILDDLPHSLPRQLYRFGLSAAVEEIQVHQPTIQEILVEMYKEGRNV